MKRIDNFNNHLRETLKKSWLIFSGELIFNPLVQISSKCFHCSQIQSRNDWQVDIFQTHLEFDSDFMFLCLDIAASTLAEI